MTASIQETLYPFSTCFGCGPANPQGLHLRSFKDGDDVVAEFTPAEFHSNGMGTLNGGVIATLLDCHSGAAVFVASAQSWRSPAEFEPWVTSGLEIRYRLPTMMDQPCELRARIVESDDSVMKVKATLSMAGKTRVQAESRWVRVAK